MNIGIDLGGHNISAGLVSNGEIVAREERNTPESRSVEAVISTIHRMVMDLQENHEISSIGIGLPGMLNAERNLVQRLTNFSEWRNVPLVDRLEYVLGRPVFIENDANCYALGEGVAGAARGINDYVVFTLGTGIGGGIVINGHLLHGSHGMAGEIGHIAVGGDFPCGCGALGHVESLSSADHLESFAREAGLDPDVSSLWERRRDIEIWPIWARALDALGCAIASCLHILDPEAIVLGGGISRAGNLIDELMPFVRRYTAVVFRPHIDIRLSELGSDAAIIGAASLVEDQDK